MSAETIEWLNLNTLIGFTDKRGTAWHYKEEVQGDETNHYPGAIPVADVIRRLFYWKPEKGIITVTYAKDGVAVEVPDLDHLAVIHPDTEYIFGIHGADYQIHDYEEWLLTNVGNILDSGLDIGSAGLLRNGGQAWVQVEMPDTIETPEGVAFRPFLTASTSLDGTLATTYNTGAQAVVCDNTLALNLRNAAAMFKVKHTKDSLTRLNDARDALNIIHKLGDDFAAEIKTLCETEVSESQWQGFLNLYVPFPEEQGRGMTIAENKRADLRHLWTSDERVSPWTGTAFGVVQAVNTWTHHFATVRGADRAERNNARMVTGGVNKLDHDTLATLDKVLATV